MLFVEIILEWRVFLIYLNPTLFFSYLMLIFYVATRFHLNADNCWNNKKNIVFLSCFLFWKMLSLCLYLYLYYTSQELSLSVFYKITLWITLFVNAQWGWCFCCFFFTWLTKTSTDCECLDFLYFFIFIFNSVYWIFNRQANCSCYFNLSHYLNDK